MSAFRLSGSGGGGEAEGSEGRGSAGLQQQDGLETQGELLALSSSSPAITTTTATTQGETAFDSRARAKGPPEASEGAVVPAEPSPTELQAPSAVNVEELQRRISESFSRKLAEWERRKYRGRPTTPEMEHKGARSRKEKEGKEERSRSKKSREEKERERQEKLREREMQKVEKEQVKLEKEKVRIEKERQRALEKQAKLERMKGRLSQADSEAASAQQTLATGSPPPGVGPGAPDTVAQCKVTAEFKKKLEDWEQMKGGSLSLPPPDPDGATPFLRPSSPPPTFPTLGPQSSREREQASGKPPPLTLQPYYTDTPEERSPVDKAASDISYGDDSTSVTEEGGHTRTNITSLERANSELLREVSRKEEEYSMLQEEVHKLNSKLDKVRQEHAAEMARFRWELEAGTVAGPVQLEVGELESTVRELEEKIALMENAGDQLAESMETAAIGKWQSVEGEEVVSQQLVDMVDQMKDMLVQASLSRELSQKTLALHNFEKVYCHAMKLQVQMNNLRVSQLERNKEIMLIKRQLLLQEVNNVLLQAHITRRETELYQYREARRLGIAGVRRWNTFSGQGVNEARPPLLRNISLQDSDDPFHPSSPPPPPQPTSTNTTSAAKSSSKHDDIPCIADEDASIPTAGIAEGTSRRARETAGAHPSPSPSSSPLTTSTTTITTTTTTTTLAPTPEKSTDHQESHVASKVAATTTTIPTSSQATSSAGQQLPPTAQRTRAVERGETRVSSTSPSVASAGTTADASTLSAASPVPFSSSAIPEEKETRMRPSSTETSEMTTAKTTTAASEVSKVETGSPTLLAQTSGASSPSAAIRPAADKGLKKPPETETPTQPIPERPDTGGSETLSPPAPSASPEDDKYSQPESVMKECTKSVLGPEASSPPPPGEPSSRVPLPRAAEAAAGGVDITSKGPSHKAAVRSPVLRQRYLRRQKEEREKRKDRSASPKSSHSGDSGKPPLPRQSTPHQSPSATHRSKSVGDMDGFEPDRTPSAAPLKDVIQKFEKRATVCETEERKIEFRKTPSPTLHLPRVGLVSRVRRLKPAAELLQESQRYRSGHSIYATRIMQRYLPGKSPQSGAAAPGTASGQDKENVSGQSYVQSMVKRLSRESTPVKSAGSSSASSSLSLHRTDSPGKAHSDLVSSLVQKLSSSCGPSDSSQKTASSSIPLKDRTNEGQVKKLTQTFSVEEAHGPTTPDQPRDMASSDRTRAAEGVTLQPASVTEVAVVTPHEAKPDSTISPASHTSMPALASDQPPPVAQDGARERAATYCVSEGDRPRSQQLRGADNGSESIEHIAEEFLDPSLLSIRERKGKKISPSSSTNSKNALCCQSSACAKSKSSSSSSSSPQASRVAKIPSSPKSQERRGAGREKMETIGVLCKQSMSFDLGVSLRAQSPEATPQRPQSAESLRPVPEIEAGSREGAKARPSSTSSEGETAASSEEKKKSRARFLDSSWLQKPKKFFKVSK